MNISKLKIGKKCKSCKYNCLDTCLKSTKYPFKPKFICNKYKKWGGF